MKKKSGAVMTKIVLGIVFLCGILMMCNIFMMNEETDLVEAEAEVVSLRNVRGEK